MKQYLLTGVIACFCNWGFAQVKLVNTDLKNDDSAIIFRGVANHFELVGNNVPELNLVQVKGGKMFRKSNNSFVIDFIDSDSVQINVSEMVGDEKRLLVSKLLKSVDLSEPKVDINYQKDTVYSNGQILNWSRFEVKFDNPNYIGSWEVAHFEITLSDSTGKIIYSPTFVSGKYLRKANTDNIMGLPSKSKIIFSDVILTYPDGGYRKYRDIIQLKN